MRIPCKAGALSNVLLLNFAAFHVILPTVITGKTISTMTETRHVNLEIRVNPSVQFGEEHHLLEDRLSPYSSYDVQSTSNFGYVRLFRQNNFQGDSQVLQIYESQCVNLPYEWENKATSIDTLGLCVLLWELEECNGRHRIIRGDDNNDDNLSTSARKRTPHFSSIELC